MVHRLSAARAWGEMFLPPAYLFVFVIGMGVLWVIALYIIDVSQTKHAIRRNFPVVGRFRYMFEHLGEFFRQYFFAQDREEMPFNRAERSWIYRAAKHIDATVAFGSTRDLRRVGTKDVGGSSQRVAYRRECAAAVTGPEHHLEVS